MENKAKQFTEAINSAVYGSAYMGDNPLDINALYLLSKKNSLTALVYCALSKMPYDKEKYADVLTSWKNETLFGSINQMKKNSELQRVLLEFASNQIQYAVFKGITLSILYPQDGIRHSGDADIWVAEQDFDKAYELLLNMGYVKDEAGSKECVYNMLSSSLYIEMHKYLWEDYTGKKIDMIKELGWTSPSSFVKVKVGNNEYTSLGYTEHLEYMFFHTIKHYVYKGFGIRHLLDIALYVNEYTNRIDITRFWSDMEKIGYSTFCLAALSSCAKYLRMDSNILQGKNSLPEDFIERFILASIDSGTFGDPLVRTTELDGFYDEKSDKNRTILSFFPRYKEMKRQYEWLSTPILLPIAWMYRIFKFIRNPNLVKDKKEHLKNDEIRQTLMEELELK